MQLHIGMTTAPRPTPYVGRAYSSLRAAGFTQPLHLFLEPGAPFTNFEPHPDAAVRHFSAVKLGCYRNWQRGLKWLALRAGDNDWVLMLQDDVVWRAGAAGDLAAARESWHAARDGFGFASAYTSPAMVPRDPPAAPSWVAPAFHNNAFWGALALLFTAESARALLAFPRFVRHDHHRKLDVLVGNCMRDMGRRMLVAVPSLCDHVGEVSTLGRHTIPGNQWARRGYMFREAP